MRSIQEIRKSAARCFIAIGGGTAIILLIAIAWLSLRVDAQALSHIVLIVGAAMFAIIGMIIYFAIRFDTECASDNQDKKPPIKSNYADS